MSLQVWLPLNGNINNQGLTQLNYTTQGSFEYIENGKIGKAISSGQITMSAENMQNIFSKGECSICFWIYVNAETGSTAASDRPMLFGNNINRRYSLFQYPTCNDFHFSWWKNDQGNTESFSNTCTNAFPSYAWTHAAITYKNKTVTIYINGQKKFTETRSYDYNPVSLNYDTILFSNNNNKRYLNDYRIYDHCLSQKEIEEISKGLVLHYPLNNHYLAENLLVNSSGYEGIQNWSGLISSEEEYGRKYFKVQRTDTTTTGRIFIIQNYNSSLPLKNLIDNRQVGDTFTISGWYKVPSNEIQDVVCNVFIRWYSQDNSIQVDRGFYTLKNTKDLWIRFENTFTVPENVSETKKLQFMFAFSKGLATIYFKNLKVEIGNKATQWCPAKIDSLYSTLGYNNNIIYDTSGYCNNGTIVGSLNAIASSPRYDYCIEHLDSCADYIYRPYLSFLGNSGFTFSCWINPSSYSRTHNGIYGVGNQYILSQGRNIITSETDHTYGASLTMNNGKIYFVCGSSNLYSNTTVSIGEWAHIVGVWTGTQTKIYINGVLKNSANDNKIDWSEAQNSLVIGKMAYGKSSSTAYFPFVGKISDVRIYATALTDSQIKELYNTSMSVDSSGNVFARKLVEE